MFVNIGPIELASLMPHGSVVAVRSLHQRVVYCGTVRSFGFKGGVLGLVLEDVSYRKFGCPRQVNKRKGGESFEFDAYESRLINTGDIALKSVTLGNVAYVRLAKPPVRKAA